LSCDYLVHLGVDHASDSDKQTRSMTATGALVWMLYFSQQTDWGAGWPLRQRGRGGVESELLVYGSSLIWTITLIQVTALVISAVRQSTHVLEEMDREDQEHDLLRSRSDSHQAFDGITAYRDKGN
jgi:heme exporter protein D